jgi:ABC-type nitrate/sulfonate/bicarbonate transport system ATPase subunit
MIGPRLRIDDVSRAFDSGNVIQDISLDIHQGEFVSIVGPSGSGKSTLFNIVSGLIQPTGGRVLIDGRDVTGERGHVGYMLQKDLLLPWRTVVGNIVLGAALRRKVTREDRQRAAELATRYGLGEFLNHYPQALSGGMRQRVAFMRTLALQADLLLLDEPFGALDAQTRLEMQMWLLSICQELNATILFITHDVDEAIFLSDRVVVFTGRPGSIAADLPIETSRPRTIDDLTTVEFIERKREALALLHQHETPRMEVTK